MENSMTSLSQALPCNERTSESPEESGWTLYLEDFLVSNKKEDSYCSSRLETSSQVSDAASLAGKRSESVEHSGGLPLVKSGKRLSFKKRKTVGALVDDALEDTASSPVNSPKIHNLNEMDMSTRHKENTEISPEKGSVSGQKEEEEREVDFIGRESDCTELKKRGLCLVPFSVAMNYFG